MTVNYEVIPLTFKNSMSVLQIIVLDLSQVLYSIANVA